MKIAQPKTWPRCSDCRVDYVLRRALVLHPTGRTMKLTVEWVYQRDCKHHKAQPEITSEPKARRPRRTLS